MPSRRWSGPHLVSSDTGFTLLETMIAMAIMMVAFASILMVESASINTSAKAKQMNVVAMLAKNKMIETEYDFEGKTFDEYKKDDAGAFEAPFQDYTWKRKVKDVTFPAFNINAGSNGSEASQGGGQDEAATQLTKLMSNFLTKAVREVDITVTWKRGSGEQSYSVATYWVNLNNAFQLTDQ